MMYLTWPLYVFINYCCLSRYVILRLLNSKEKKIFAEAANKKKIQKHQKKIYCIIPNLLTNNPACVNTLTIQTLTKNRPKKMIHFMQITDDYFKQIETKHCFWFLPVHNFPPRPTEFESLIPASTTSAIYQQEIRT